MAKAYCVLFLGVVAVLGGASALSDDEKSAIKSIVTPILEQCGKDHDVTKEQFLAAKESEDIDALKPCYYACFFKKVGLMNAEGLYAPDAAREVQKQVIKDEEFNNKLEAISEKCKSVNEKEVGDGADGCERAKLLVACFQENKNEFLPFLE